MYRSYIKCHKVILIKLKMSFTFSEQIELAFLSSIWYSQSGILLQGAYFTPLNFRVPFLHTVVCSIEREKSGMRDLIQSSCVVAPSRSVLEATEICLLFLRRSGRASR